MADKKDNEEGKEKDEELVIVTDDVRMLNAQPDDDGFKKDKRKEAAGGEGADDDDRDEDHDEDARDDARAGESDEDQDRDTIRANRRKERKSRAEKRRRNEQRRIELERENRFLSTRNEQLERSTTELARRVDQLEVTTVDGRISQFKAAIRQAEATMAAAVDEKDGAANIEAQRIRDDLRDKLAQLETYKAEQEARGGDDTDDDRKKPDARVLARTKEWLADRSWFDPARRDEDSALVGALDDALIREGRFDPATDAYWDELDRRIAKKLPHLKKKVMNGRERDDGDDTDDEGDDDRGGREERGARGNGKGNGRERRVNGSGPRFRQGGADRELGNNEVYLSRDRLEAMAEAGIELDSPQGKRLLKRYRDHDRDPRNAR